MKLVIAGSRHIEVCDAFLTGALELFNLWPDLTEIIEGGAAGVDESAKYYAHATDTPCKTFKADWDKWGKIAGPKRNQQMAEYADALLLIWDGQSKGSANMKRQMLKLNKPVHEIVISKMGTN